MKRKMVVKVQIPLMTNDKSPQALIYNEDRSYEMYSDAKIIGQIMQGTYKAFYEVSVDGDDIQFGKRVEDPGW